MWGESYSWDKNPCSNSADVRLKHRELHYEAKHTFHLPPAVIIHLDNYKGEKEPQELWRGHHISPSTMISFFHFLKALIIPPLFCFLFSYPLNLPPVFSFPFYPFPDYLSLEKLWTMLARYLCTGESRRMFCGYLTFSHCSSDPPGSLLSSTFPACFLFPTHQLIFCFMWINAINRMTNLIYKVIAIGIVEISYKALKAGVEKPWYLSLFPLMIIILYELHFLCNEW